MFPDIIKITLLTISLALLGGCRPTTTDSSSSEAVEDVPFVDTADVKDQQPEATIPADSYRLSVGSTSDADNAIERELLIDMLLSAKQISISLDDDQNLGLRVPLTLQWESEFDLEKRCAFKVTARLSQEDGSNTQVVDVTAKLTAGDQATELPFQFQVGENMKLVDVIALEAKPGLYKQGKPLALGRINGEELSGPFTNGLSLTLWVGQVDDEGNPKSK